LIWGTLRFPNEAATPIALAITARSLYHTPSASNQPSGRPSRSYNNKGELDRLVQAERIQRLPQRYECDFPLPPQFWRLNCSDPPRGIVSVCQFWPA